MTGIGTVRAPRLRGARAVFTTRHGGVGRGDFASANLGRHVGDEEAAVERNRALLVRAMGAPVVFVDQVHGADVLVLPAQRAAPVDRIPVARADALVTDRTDLALAVMVADCLPVLLADPEGGVVAAAHAGRRGLLGGVLEATVEAMERLGARPERILAAVGPSVCGGCYEVPAPMREDAAESLPATAATTTWGTPSLDLRAGAVEALGRCGVAPVRIDAEPPCTVEDDDYFSYRRAARTGRFAGVIRREPEAR